MKRIYIIAVLLIVQVCLIFSDSGITRGPDVGEIYFLGPTATGEGLYHSTDFGETATCMDSTLNFNIDIGRITADLTPGVIYGYSMPENLWISYNYGQEGSWIFRSNNVSQIHSGRTVGHIYAKTSRHSEDYGINFINHTCNGYFGSYKASEIDNVEDVGYALVYEYGNNDSLWLLISYDNFENYEIQHSFDWNGVYGYRLSRGFLDGELYLTRNLFWGDGSTCSELWFSSDFGSSWIFKNYIFSGGIVGGRQEGELYVGASFRESLGEIRHIYIYHSLDYGETFTSFHPFSYGPEAHWANFEANTTTGTAPLTVQFTDMSNGENIYSWEWDFDLDGTIDSYEQNPEYTYQDTGYYSVKLYIYYTCEGDGYVKTNYIHVTNGNDVDECKIQNVKFKIQNYPNPFNPITEISYELPSDVSQASIEIYNLKGQRISELKIENVKCKINSVLWDGSDFASGIYLYKLNLENSSIKKMILLK